MLYGLILYEPQNLQNDVVSFEIHTKQLCALNWRLTTWKVFVRVKNVFLKTVEYRMLNWFIIQISWKSFSQMAKDREFQHWNFFSVTLAGDVMQSKVLSVITKKNIDIFINIFTYIDKLLIHFTNLFFGLYNLNEITSCCIIQHWPYMLPEIHHQFHEAYYNCGHTSFDVDIDISIRNLAYLVITMVLKFIETYRMHDT